MWQEGLMKSHLIQVSEPWEFVGPEGKRKFSVKGLGFVESTPKENWGNGFYLVRSTFHSRWTVR